MESSHVSHPSYELRQKITTKEFAKAAITMEEGKTSGLHGEFFLDFWNIVGHDYSASNNIIRQVPSKSDKRLDNLDLKEGRKEIT